MPVVLLVGGALLFGVFVWLVGWQLGADSAVYRAGALTFLHGDPLYDPERLSTLPSWVALPFTYPPAAALLFVPLTALPSGLTWGVLAAGSVLSLAVVVRLGLRPAPASWRRWPVVAGLTVLALGLEPVWKTIFLGQVNLLLLAALLLDLLVVGARGSRWGGVLVGVAAAVKLTPLIFVVHLFLIGRRADAARALGTFAVLQGVMFAVMPRDAIRYWTEAATDPDRVGSVHWIFNQSLNGLLNRATELAPWSLPVALAIGAVLAVPSIWLVRRLHARGEALAAVLVSGFLALLISPVSWTHHWVWAVPLIVLLAAKGRYWAALAVTAFFGSAFIMFVPNGGETEFGWGLGFGVLGNGYVLAAAFGLLAVAALELRKRAKLV
nr:glycosyltransferase 87 family protein [Amycolatopsis nigrescens]